MIKQDKHLTERGLLDIIGLKKVILKFRIT